MKKLFLAALAAATLAACSTTAPRNNYKVTVAVANPTVGEGDMLYLINYDTSEKLDSTVMRNGTAVFEGNVATPAFVRIASDGNRLGLFILEKGNISVDAKGVATVDNGDASDTSLNGRLNAFVKKVDNLNSSFDNLAQDDEAARDSIYKTYFALMDSTMNVNIENPIGYYLFLQNAYDMSREELDAALAKTPSLKSYKRIQGVVDVFDKRDATAPGKMFTDFEVTYDGTTKRLSDYVGKGKYTLVDFWASWCGPCMRKMPHLKEIYSKYAPQGLQVLGVAVWDEPQNSLNTIKSKELPWEQIVNAQTIPTDIYGILGIPCIMLFGPDGTIIGRDFEDDELEQILSSALTPENTVPQKEVTAADVASGDN